ncbi:MAG: S8 family serine peptidase, partial [Actinomycetota bacterium]|nr:S8 family serine peptidase [Actinomycetota bacterium]
MQTKRSAAMAVAAMVALAVPALPARAGAEAHVPGEALVVKLAGGEAALPGVADAVDADVDSAVAPRTYVLEVDAGEGSDALRRLRSDRRVAWVEREVRYRASVAPDDPCYAGCGNPSVRQWNLTRVRAGEAWDVTRGRADVLVAVLDTGVDAGHPDLAGKVTQGGVYSVSPTANDLDGHGTHVAGIIAAATNNSRGVAGMGWDTKVLSIKVLDDEGWGSSSGIAKGIHEAVRAGADVINLSLGGDYSNLVAEAVASARSAGALVVAAAGNDGSEVKQYPAALDGVLAVAASDADDKLASFSNRGAAWVDIAAPGTSIVSTVPGGYALMSGTSMASPMVAGAAALTFASSPGITADQVAARLTASSAPISGTGTLVQHGRLDAAGAVVRPTPPPPAPAPAP